MVMVESLIYFRTWKWLFIYNNLSTCYFDDITFWCEVMKHDGRLVHPKTNCTDSKYTSISHLAVTKCEFIITTLKKNVALFYGGSKDAQRTHHSEQPRLLKANPDIGLLYNKDTGMVSINNASRYRTWQIGIFTSNAFGNCNFIALCILKCYKASASTQWWGSRECKYCWYNYGLGCENEYIIVRYWCGFSWKNI